MVIFKCKMCGGDLKIAEGLTVAECEYCGTKQTVPASKDENLVGLFNRANVLRSKAEFDRAESLYEKIIQSDETQAEGYWGLILCKYGIEYVEDPTAFKRIPTCHRASFDSIIADEDYKSALKYADSVQKSVYESEATEIDRLQKEILALSQKEEPYDVFICYKETDESGKRTQDSVIANDIYHQLTQEGFKVFYAAITLEDKLGSAYEPCIFAALNSAKVMLSIGTKPEYFNAVWVKNEWSRFLKIIKKEPSKLLIPCYRDMDAYELPDEFAHLQAQDMSKIGFINDLVRGIKKVLVKDKPTQKEVVHEVVQSTGGANVDALIKRVFMYLEDGEWKAADEYCEKILDINPEYAEAYLGKLMAEYKCKEQIDLVKYANEFETNNNYQKIIKFAGASLVDRLKEYIKQNIYNTAFTLMDNAEESLEYNLAAEEFEKIIEYRDSKEKFEQCIKLAETAKKDEIMSEADSLFETYSIYNINKAIDLYQSIPGWKDVDNKVVACEKKIKNLQNEETIRKKREKKQIGIVVLITTIVLVFTLLYIIVVAPMIEYKEALTLVEEKKYTEAYEKFAKLDEFLDSKEKSNAIYQDYKFEKLEAAEIGDNVLFGTFEQDKKTSNGKEEIKWVVLDKKDDKVLVISKYALGRLSYSASKEKGTWETSTLRLWLNDNFFNSAFSNKEKEKILTTLTSEYENSENGTKYKNDTYDKVFLLSVSEAEKYLYNKIKKCEPTTLTGEDDGNPNGYVCWWLRTMDHNENYSAYQYSDTGVLESIDYRIYTGNVRPAMWVNIQ